MIIRVKLVALLLAVPLLAIVAGTVSRASADGDLRAVIRADARRAGREVDERRLEAFTFAVPCTDVRFGADNASACGTYSGFGWLALGGGIAAVTGVLLVAAIAVAGRACRRDRRLLVTVFGPGLRAVFAVLVVLIVLHALLLIAGLVMLGVSGGGIARLLLMVAIGAVLGVYRLIRAAVQAVERARVNVVGKVLEDGRHARLRDAVADAARAIGAETPHRVVAGLDPNFFVTEADVNCLDGQMQGRTLYLSLPLCRILTVGELKAIIGHELGHFKGQDTTFSQRFYPIYAGAGRSLVALAQSGGGVKSVAILPAFYLLAFFLESFATAEATISRERELAADAEAARAAGVDAAASALVKVHAYAPAWGVVVEGMRHALGQRRALTNASLAFADLVGRAAAPERVREAAQVRLAHPTDSHPPLVDRLQALGRTLDEEMQPSLAVPPEPAAIDLFDGPGQMEEVLSQAQHQWLLATGQAALGPEPPPPAQPA